MQLLQVLLLWISGTATVIVASKCAADPHNRCLGWTLDASGVCLRIPSDKKNFNDARQDCQTHGGDLVHMGDLTDGVRECLEEMHPQGKFKMVFVVGRKDCTLYDLERQKDRYPGCHKRRFYACQKPAPPAATPPMMTSEDPSTEIPFTAPTSTEPPATADPFIATSTALPSDLEQSTEMESTKMRTTVPTTSTVIADSFNDVFPDGFPDFTDWWDQELGDSTHAPTSGAPRTTDMTSAETSQGGEASSGTSDDLRSSSEDSSMSTYTSTYMSTYTENSSTMEADPSTEMEGGVDVAATDSPAPEVSGGMAGGSSVEAGGSPPPEPSPGVDGREQLQEVPCPAGFQAVTSLCLSVHSEPRDHSGAAEACTRQGAQLMRLDQLRPEIREYLEDKIQSEGASHQLRLDNETCFNFHNGGIEEGTCYADYQTGYICAIDHGRVGGSRLGTAAPVAGATIAVTSVALLIYHTLKARNAS